MLSFFLLLSRTFGPRLEPTHGGTLFRHADVISILTFSDASFVATEFSDERNSRGSYGPTFPRRLLGVFDRIRAMNKSFGVLILIKKKKKKTDVILSLYHTLYFFPSVSPLHLGRIFLFLYFFFLSPFPLFITFFWRCYMNHGASLKYRLIAQTVMYKIIMVKRKRKSLSLSRARDILVKCEISLRRKRPFRLVHRR